MLCNVHKLYACNAGRCRTVLSVDILHRGCNQNHRLRSAVTSRCLPPQSVEHHGLRRRRYRVNVIFDLESFSLYTRFMGSNNEIQSINGVPRNLGDGALFFVSQYRLSSPSFFVPLELVQNLSLK